MQKGAIYVFEQDYVIRLIEEIIRGILKLLFTVDIGNPIENLLEDKKPGHVRRITGYG